LFLEALRPNVYVDAIGQISLEDLSNRGIKGVIVDLDNTLTEWNKDQIPPEIEGWLRVVREQGFGLCLVSNNAKTRVARVAECLDIPFVYKAGKPRRRAFRQAMDLLGTEPGSTAVVGDQIFTDVFGGNRLGLYTILVVPISRHEFIGTRMMRQLEWLVLRHLFPKT